jgi:hypothetical protein
MAWRPKERRVWMATDGGCSGPLHHTGGRASIAEAPLAQFLSPAPILSPGASMTRNDFGAPDQVVRRVWQTSACRARGAARTTTSGLALKM